MSNAYFKVPEPVNEPIKAYAPGSPEKAELKAKIAELKAQEIDVPIIIGGKEIRTGDTAEMRIPHEHGHKLGVYHKAGEKEVAMAVEAALEAQKAWAVMPWEQRVAIFLKAADLLAGPWRATINAATMLGQSKTAYQAEIDAACELIDFWRFNAHYMAELMKDQPYSPAGMWNRVEYRTLEGFVFAVTPFNFTSIAGNLPTAPAIVGGVALWKPASSAVYSAYFLVKLLEEAGLPAGVVNFIPGSGGKVGNPVLANPNLAGIHFTGSTAVFQDMWKTVGENIANYKYYPRIVGETGGKDFTFAHNSADVDALAIGHSRCLRVPGPEVLGSLTHVYSQIHLAGLPRKICRRSGKYLRRRSGEFHEFHERRHRQGRVHQHHRLHQVRGGSLRRGNHHRWQIRRQQGLLHRADHHRDDRSEVQVHGRRNLRSRADDLCL